MEKRITCRKRDEKEVITHVGVDGEGTQTMLSVWKRIENNNEEFYTFENATLCPIDKRLVDKSIMSEKQINWLNNYHRDVWQKLSPFVEGEAKGWLRNATEEI